MYLYFLPGVLVQWIYFVNQRTTFFRQLPLDMSTGMIHHGFIHDTLQIPSGYFIADVYLYFDALFRKRIFHPNGENMQTRTTLAGEEAIRTKKCLQALRYLWRNAQDNAHDLTVQQLKAHLCPSPVQLQRSDSETVMNNPAPQDDGHADFEGGESEEEDDSEPDDAEVEVEGAEGVSVGHAPPEAPIPGDSDNESLKAPTLRLGGSPDRVAPAPAGDESSDEDVGDDAGDAGSPDEPNDAGSPNDEEVDKPDSQVSSGWLGKFYAKYGEFGKTWNPLLPKCVQEGDRPAILEHIRRALEEYSREIGG